ncbi:MAG: GTP-binding protein [Chloroflexi bacterium]|nr:GTP-binding protein [Chloroflexota bacterium]MDL1943515.1 GTP-binding protein [Chloroflexi bacterium CFX2]
MLNATFLKKVCILGDFGVGKTSLVQRFVHSSFEEKYLGTIGVTISQKEVETEPNAKVRLIVWDLSGRDKFNGNHTSYLSGASGAFLVCDLSRENTRESLMGYLERLRGDCPAARVVILGNKSDLFDSVHRSKLKVIELAQKTGLPYFLTSAKTGKNVDAAFRALAQTMVDIR